MKVLNPAQSRSRLLTEIEIEIEAAADRIFAAKPRVSPLSPKGARGEGSETFAA